MVTVRDKTTIVLTRGDDAYVSIPVVQRTWTNSCISKPVLKKYYIKDTEQVKLQVRTVPVVDRKTTNPELIVFEGDVSVQEGIPIWYISRENSTIDSKTYYWDLQLTTEEGLVTTLISGLLEITPEVTL